MNTRKEFRGTWFLPSNEERRVAGILIFDPINGAELELFGSFQEMGAIFITPQDNSEFIILGLTSDSEPITLYNCFRIRTNGKRFRKNQETGIPTIKYFANFILLGHHFKNEDDLKFNNLSFKLTHLESFVPISGFKYKPEFEDFNEKKIEISYQLPKSIDFEIDDNCNGKINFSTFTPNLTIPQIKMEIVQDVEIEIISKNEISLESFRKYLSKFQNFVVLALYESTHPTSIEFRSEQLIIDYGELGKVPAKIEFFYKVSNRKLHKQKSPFEMLFSYPNISSEFSTLIRNWFKKYELLEPAFNLLFDQFYNSSRFTVNTFLNLAQSAETFHARLHDHTRMDKKDYTVMKNEIRDKVPEKYHSWLNEQFAFGNHLNLDTRLNELVDNYSNSLIDIIIKDKKEFIQQVKDSRNYYTHYSSTLEKRALEDVELMRLTEKLKMLLVSAFLHEIGLSKDKISELFENAKYQLFEHLTRN